MPCKFPAVFAVVAIGLFAADRDVIPYASVQSVPTLPAELQNADKATWLSWARRHDKAIRSRLAQGDLDSMVNLLLYGTSFTRQPRISMEGEGIAAASKSGVLRARVDDLAAGLRSPGKNERLSFLRGLVERQGIDPESSDGLKQTGLFLFQNLMRVVQERKTLAEPPADTRIPSTSDDPSSLLDRSSLFRNRGLSLDTGLFPDFEVEQTLRDLKERSVLRAGEVRRAAVIGPGLDFIDKSEAAAFDYYPEQTLQPFAVYDSLVRLGLAKAGELSVSVLDISPQVIEHLRRARDHAAHGTGYDIQLPRDAASPANLTGYWRSFGDQVGTQIEPIQPPRLFPNLVARAVRIRPDVVLACEAADLDIVIERLALPASKQFDLIVATNVFVYYDPFEQTLALENAGAMLKPGGLLLTNDRLTVAPRSSMRLAGVSVIPFHAGSISASQALGWYQRR